MNHHPLLKILADKWVNHPPGAYEECIVTASFHYFGLNNTQEYEFRKACRAKLGISGINAISLSQWNDTHTKEDVLKLAKNVLKEMGEIK